MAAGLLLQRIKESRNPTAQLLERVSVAIAASAA
jgi:hypothetical protein